MMNRLVRNSVDSLTLAFIAIGAHTAFQSCDDHSGLGLEGGFLEYVDNVTQSAELVDRVGSFFDEHPDGHPTVFAYDVAEAFGLEMGKSLIQVDPITAPALLKQIMVKVGYDEQLVDQAIQQATLATSLNQDPAVFVARAHRLSALLEKRYARKTALKEVAVANPPTSARKDELLHASMMFLSNLSESCHEDAMGIMVEYDGTECDGYCLRQDIANELDVDLD